MDRRDCLKQISSKTGVGMLFPALLHHQSRPSPVINGAEHAWVINDPEFPIDAKLSNCPGSKPKRNYSIQHILSQMRVYGIDRVVISHVCYYGTDNAYTLHCIRQYPEQFTGVGLLVGHRLHRPDDPENPRRLNHLMDQGLAGLRLSPIYDPGRVWLNDPVSYPLWSRAQERGAVFNIFLTAHQIDQVADMANRYPGVNIVIDHFAMIDIRRPDDEGIERLLDLQRFPNVFIRTSLHNPSHESIPYRDMWPYLKRIYHTFGPRRMIYANFYELLIMQDLIPFFSSDDKEWILGKTALSVYFSGK